MATGLLLALALMATTPASAPASGGEPLPPGAPTDDYALTGWCYGALNEYLQIYDQVKPELVAIDKMWGSPVKEAEPYASDIAAARLELKVLAGALEAAEKASPKPIAPQGAAAIKMGEGIWRVVELRSRRELARAWLTWGLPDRCGTTARSLAARSALLGKALTYNTKPDEAQPMAPAPGGALSVKPYEPVTPARPLADEPAPVQAAEPPAEEPPATAATEPAASSPEPPVQARDMAASATHPQVLEETPAPVSAPAAADVPPAASATKAPEPVPAAAPPAPPPPTSDEAMEPVL